MRSPLRVTRRIACSRRAASELRLGRPVSASWTAACRSCSSASMRAVTSSANERIEARRPVSSKNAELYHSHQMERPSRVKLRESMRFLFERASVSSRVRERTVSIESGCTRPISGDVRPSTSSWRQPKIASAWGDQRFTRRLSDHSTTASGVFSIWLAISASARPSASWVRLSSFTSSAQEKMPMTSPCALRWGRTLTDIQNDLPSESTAWRS